MNNYIFNMNNYTNHKKTDLINQKLHNKRTNIKISYNEKLKKYLLKNAERIGHLDCGYDTTLTNKELNKLINLRFLVCGRNQNITPEKLINLESLNCIENETIQDYHIVNLKKLKSLFCDAYGFISNDGIKKLTNLSELFRIGPLIQQ